MLWLSLSQDIQHLPWENIPILRDHCVTRMPSLQFVQSHGVAVSEVSTPKCYYQISFIKTIYVNKH